LTINSQHPQAESVQQLFFPPSNRWSLHPDPNPSSSTFQASIQMVNQDQALQVNLILLKLIRYYFSRIPSQIFLLPSFVFVRSSYRNLDSRRGSINLLFPRACRNF
jgi:hypothetical protein